MPFVRVQTYIAFGLLLVVAGYCLAFEKSLYAFGCSLIVFAALLLVLGRLLTASACLVIITAVIVAVSVIKKGILQVALHSSDIILMADRDMESYLWSDQRGYMVLLYGVLALAIFLVVVMYLRDTTFVPRLISFILVAVAAAVSFALAGAHRENPQFNFTNVDRHLSNFYASVSETAGIFENNSYFGVPKNTVRAGSILQRCAPVGAPVNIILIHEESLFPPSLYGEIDYDRKIDPFFRSSDGEIHWLRTETFGTGSWLTEFSIFSGLSSETFGGVKALAPKIMTGKLGDSLPQWLKACGYRNIEFNPYPEGFAFAGRFHRSIGFDLIMDKTAQKANGFAERDKFYFANAIAEMNNHFSRSKAPLFTYIITAATHFPYNYAVDPDESVAGGSAKAIPHMNEYLRRVGFAIRDYREFVASLKTNFLTQKFLIVHYGDHQPLITASLVAKADGNSTIPKNSVGYLTYFTVEGVNYAAPDLPKLKTLDIPYLGSLVLKLARLPLSEAAAERLKLLEACGGRYANCKNKDLIAEFQKRLFVTGALKLR